MEKNEKDVGLYFFIVPGHATPGNNGENIAATGTFPTAEYF